MTIVLKNNASDFLAASIDSVQTTLTLQSATSFPNIGGAQYFYITLQDTAGQIEIAKVTARSGNNFTVVRGQDGTSAVSFAAGSRVELRVNVGSVDDFVEQNSELGFYTPAGSGAVTHTIQAKLRESVSVFDFMTPAQIADVKAFTYSIDTITAIEAALAAAPAVYFPPGGYLVSRAIALTGSSGNGKTIYGSQTFNTIIRRVTTNSEVIEGNTVTCVMYIGGLDHIVENFIVTSGTGVPVDGVYLNCARTTLNDVRSELNRNAFLAKQPYLCIFNRLWAKDSYETGFNFDSADPKTTLIFNNCTCENVGNAFLIRNAYYSVMNSCAVDYANYTATGNPYGRGYGSRSTANAIYQINAAGDIVLNGCGSENSYGNGFVGFSTDGAASVTVNNGTCFNIVSTHVPSQGAGWAVGPFSMGRGPQTLNINGGRYSYTNTTAPVVADLVAFNYDAGAYGARKCTFVNVGGLDGDYETAFAGLGDFNRYCRIGVNSRNQYTRFITGSGTVISIPIVSQNASTQRHVIKILAINNDANTSVSYGTEVGIGFASLTSILNITTWIDENVASVAASSMDLQITLSNALVNPTIVIEVLSTDEKLIDLDNITIA